MERGRVRAASREDLPAIATLHAKIYPSGAGGLLERRLAYLDRILFRHPWSTDRLPSLVYEDSAGQVVGFLGVMPRPMLLHDERIQMAISHNYMMDPDSRSSLGSVNLAKAFFSGPQSFSVCQPNTDISRKLWQVGGATPARLYSFSWLWPLRPTGYVVDALRRRGLSRKLLSVVAAFARFLDAGARRTGLEVFQIPRQQHSREELTAEGLLGCMQEFSSHRILRPEYNEQTFNWLFDAMREKQRLGTLIGRRVRKVGGQVLGYYLYYANAGGVSYVLQVGGRKSAVAEVLNELANDAWENGGVALSGWLDPHYAEEISAKALYCKYEHEAPLYLHAVEPAVEFAVATGRAFLTPLEGEWGLWFHN